ncbi:PDZ and LIM domain protein Zasp-like [Cylas formicarius]|uniref:PDZ and LIM domain protein Zasp-like n=1 Tax=Cylas formicarius TaxID=197179 RepID=UPI0029584ABA|nr:PDZ and LIM domain protein Zasp-like [Cylas formicarius]
MATLTTIRLNKSDSPSWGFRLQGGKDFGAPLVIQKVNGGSPAERAGLIAGDSVIKINNTDVFNLSHKEAQDVIVRAGPSFDMVITRGGSTWKPKVVPTGAVPKPSPVINNISPVTKTSLVAPPSDNFGAVGTGYNSAAKPFNAPVVNGGLKPANKQYNSPIKLYSEDTIAETLLAQTEVLSTGALGVNFKKNEKDYDVSNSAVYRMLKEAENDPGTPSNDVEPDSGVVTSPNRGSFGLKHVEAPQNRPTPPSPQLPPGQNVCAECERLIVGVFVRIKDKNLHVECFKCSTCGTSLKNVGYYNINNKLYCDIHAKSAALKIAAPAPGLAPLTVSPGAKGPSSAISTALSSHPLQSPSLLSPKSNLSSPFQSDEKQSVDGVSPPLPALNNYSSEPSNKISSNSSLYNSSAPLSFSKYINKSSGNLSGPKPFSSVAAPLSPASTLPRAAPLSPQGNYPKTPFSSAISQTSYSPASTVGNSTNITWPPPPPDDSIAPTACPLFYPPPSQIETELRKRKEQKQETYESEYYTEEENSELRKFSMDETSSFYSDELSFCGRRSATECAEMLSETLDTQKLVERVIQGPPENVFPPLQPEAIIEFDNKNVKTVEIKESVQEFKYKASHEVNTDTTCSIQSESHIPAPPKVGEHPASGLVTIENSVPKKWESTLTQGIRTVSPDKDTFAQIPTRKTITSLGSALAVTPIQPFNPASKSILEPVPLPEETEPYFPPPIKSEQTEEPVKIESKNEEKVPKPRSVFVKALEIAPECPFVPIGGVSALPPPVKKKPKDPLDKLLEELPKPKERLDMRSALTTAPERSYTPLTNDEETDIPTNHQEPRKSSIDRSQLHRPLKPDELPASFKMNEKLAKPPSYYFPTIQQIIESDQTTTETRENVENIEQIITEKETIQPAQYSQQIVTSGSQDQMATNFPPFFQGFTCSFQNKTDHSQFSIEVSTTPPVPTPSPIPHTPISYIATVEEKPAVVQKETIIQENRVQQQTSNRQESFKQEVKTQVLEKQAEDVVQVKPAPVNLILHKPGTLPQYQVDLRATAEAELILMERKKQAEARIEQQKIQREQQQQMEMKDEVVVSNNKQQNSENSLQNTNEVHLTKPVILLQPGDSGPTTEDISFKSMASDKLPRAVSPRTRSLTPSMISKAPPLLPYYQEDLVAHYKPAVETHLFDPKSPNISRSPSPCLAKIRSASPSALRKSIPPTQDPKIEKSKQHIQAAVAEQIKPQSIQSCDSKLQVDGNAASCGTSASKLGQLCQVNLQHTQQQRYDDSSSRSDQVCNVGNVETRISEQSEQKHLESQSNSQYQSRETSADGLTQIQKKKTVIEEYERTQKETNIQIEKKISSIAKHPFQRINAPAEEKHSESLHVTDPKRISVAFGNSPCPFQLNSGSNLQQYTQASPQAPNFQLQACPFNLAPNKPSSAQDVSQLPSHNVNRSSVPQSDIGAGTGRQAGGVSVTPRKGRGVLNAAVLAGSRVPLCGSCRGQIRGPFITALGQIWCPHHFVCATPSCKRSLQDLGFVEEKGQLYCEYCFEQYLAPPCSKCSAKIKGDCLKAIGKNFHPECFNCVYCGKLFGNSPFFLEDGSPYCEADWNELFTTKCFACGFPVEAGDRWVEALNNNYHSQCFNCTMCKKNLEGQSFFAKGGRPFCKNHAR